METLQTVILAALAWGVIFVLQDIRNRVKLIQLVQTRRTLAMMKVANELDTLHLSIMKLHKTSGDPDNIDWIRKRRKSLMRLRIEEGPAAHELLSGFEYPDIDDDKVFWNADLINAFGLGPDEEFDEDD